MSTKSIEFKEYDIVTTEYSDKEHVIVLISTQRGTASVIAMDHMSGYGSIPLGELTFVRREFTDPEEILP